MHKSIKAFDVNIICISYAAIKNFLQLFDKKIRYFLDKLVIFISQFINADSFLKIGNSVSL